MGNVVREGVEGIGLSPSVPKLGGKSWFTEVAIPEIVKIPDVKPDIEELLSVMVDAKIVSLRIIETPVGTSNEGEILTGKKLSIELLLKQKIKYIADEPTQSVHAAHFENKVSSLWVVVPATVKIDGKDVKIETLLMQGKLVATPYVEDIYGEKLDKRTVFKNITVLIHVTAPCAEAKLKQTKSASPDPIAKGGTLTYTIVVKNEGTVDANNVVFKDTIPSETTYNAGSFQVDGVAVAGNPTVGIKIGNIIAGATKTITFTVTVSATAKGPLKNNSEATYEYRVDSTLTKTDLSNVISTTVTP